MPSLTAAQPCPPLFLCAFFSCWRFARPRAHCVHTPCTHRMCVHMHMCTYVNQSREICRDHRPRWATLAAALSSALAAELAAALLAALVAALVAARIAALLPRLPAATALPVATALPAAAALSAATLATCLTAGVASAPRSADDPLFVLLPAPVEDRLLWRFRARRATTHTRSMMSSFPAAPPSAVRSTGLPCDSPSAPYSMWRGSCTIRRRPDDARHAGQVTTDLLVLLAITHCRRHASWKVCPQPHTWCG